MKKIITIILIFLISTLTLIGCVSPRDDNNPPQEPNYPKYIENVFGVVDGEYTEYITSVHLHIPDSNITTQVKIPSVFMRTELDDYRETTLSSFIVTGNDDVAVNTREGVIYAKKADNPQIDNLIIMTPINGILNSLQIRVTKGDCEN